MKWKKWMVYAAAIAGTEAVGALSGLLTREGMRAFNETAAQPPLSPPQAVFPVVWGTLYALMGIGAARVYLSPPSRARGWSLDLFVVQLVVNFFWSLLFFNVRAYGFSVLWLILLWGLVAGMIGTFFKADQTAAWLQMPYLVWLTFAAYLAAGVWMLNG